VYHTILIPLDTTSSDQTILKHIRPLARLCKSKLILLHVADGWAARNFGPEAMSSEVVADHAYLQKLKLQLEHEGFDVEAELAFGNPANEIIRWVKRRHCDLIAMTTHGHRLLADILLGATATKLQHELSIPILVLKDKKHARDKHTVQTN